jgi:hypothetical protein
MWDNGGRILADDVGIRKLAQVMVMITFFIMAWYCENDGKNRPPIIADGESLHLIMCSLNWCTTEIATYM